jgi:hypothetical protein
MYSNHHVRKITVITHRIGNHEFCPESQENTFGAKAA